MTRADFLDRLVALNVWKRGDQRAPHKPLLLLYALARLTQGYDRIPFSEVEPALRNLLRDFGPHRASYNPQYPFWRLQNDGLWTIVGAERIPPRKSNTDPPLTALRQQNPTGGFMPALAEALRRDPNLLAAAVQALLTHFPESYHADLLEAVGLDLAPVLGAVAEMPSTYAVYRPRRDPAFRQRVLNAYERRCAVCGLDLRLGDTLVGLEAAHIKWHQAGGPDAPSNGLALCSLHHKLFDRGAFTLSTDYEVEVAEQAHGGESFRRWLLDFHHAPVRAPVNDSYRPAGPFIDWHRREVFRAPPRP
jgi:putative restriction endonuclease